MHIQIEIAKLKNMEADFQSALFQFRLLDFFQDIPFFGYFLFRQTRIVLLFSAFNKHRRPTKSVGYFAQRGRLLFPQK